MLRYLTCSYLIIAIVIFLSSCNPDVFIKPLEVSQDEWDIPFSGGVADITVNGDWDLDRVCIDNVDLDFYSLGDGLLGYESDFIALVLSRPQHDKLCLTVKESKSPAQTIIEIYLTNDYESEVVIVNIAPCNGYSFAEIIYGEPRIVSSPEAREEGWSDIIVNNSQDIQDYELDVFDINACRTIRFLAESVQSEDIPHAMWYDELMKYITEPFSVPIPDSFPSNEGLSLSDESISFSYKTIETLERPDDLQTKISIPPGEHRVGIMWGYLIYEVPYTIFLSHPERGRPLSFSGIFTSKAYNGDWEVITW